MAMGVPPRFCPGTTSPLCPKVKPFPWSWLPQIQCCAVAWSEWGWRVCSAQCEAWGRTVTANLQLLRKTSLCSTWGLASMCTLLMSGVQASPAFLSLPVVSPPTSQGGLSPLHRTPGLGCSVCGLTHSLPMVGVCWCHLPFPLSPLPGPNTTAFLSFLPNYLCIFFTALVIQESFCHFPVDFHWELFHMQMYFWSVSGGRWAPCPLSLPSYLHQYDYN